MTACSNNDHAMHEQQANALFSEGPTDETIATKPLEPQHSQPLPKKSQKPKAIKAERDSAQSGSDKHVTAEKTEATESKAVAEVKPEKPSPVKIVPAGTADDANVPIVSRIYKIQWLKMDVAYFVANISRAGNNITFKFHSRSVGFVDKVANFGWSSLTKMRLDNKKFTPVSVERISELKKKSRNTKLKYDNAGNVILDEKNPPENISKRPEVPQADKNRTYDTLSLFLQARLQIIDIFDNKYGSLEENFTLPLYDGRRRSDINITVYKTITDNRFKVRIRQKPVSGYTQNELKETQKGDRYVDVMVDATSFIPVRGSGKSPLGSATAVYVGDCTGSLDECISHYEK